jgi:hypothetical protein
VLGEETGTGILIMLIRFLFIVFVWYMLIAPLILRLFKRYLDKQRNRYSFEVKNVLEALPSLKRMVVYSWDFSSKEKGIKRLKSFLIFTVVIILMSNPKDERDANNEII